MFIKVAQARDLTTEELSDLKSKLIDNLLLEARSMQAPTAESFETPEALINFLRTNNISDAQGHPIVSDHAAEGYVLFQSETFINVAGLQGLLSQYKAAASQQTGLQGQYFAHAIDSLVTSLKTTPGFENVNVAPASGVATKAPEGQAATSITPEKPQQAGQTAQPGQSEGLSQLSRLRPLPANGQGVFNVHTIAAMMNGLLERIYGESQEVRTELAPILNTLSSYVSNIEQNADAFRQVSPNGETQFMVGDYDQTYRGLNMMFNPGRAPGGMEHADGGHFGPVAAMSAIQKCEYIARDVGLFFSSLAQTGFGKYLGEMITQQTQASQILLALFENVSNQFSRDDRSARTTPAMRPGYSGGN
jgi:hypothetical protein